METTPDPTSYEPQQPSEAQQKVAGLVIPISAPPQRRVQQISTGMHGIVLEEREGETLVHWGTVQFPSTNPGEPPVAHKYTDWVPDSDLAPCAEKVWYGTEREKNRSLLYDPEVFGVQPDVDIT